VHAQLQDQCVYCIVVLSGLEYVVAGNNMLMSLRLANTEMPLVGLEHSVRVRYQAVRYQAHMVFAGPVS
jgi:hypothetical protein